MKALFINVKEQSVTEVFINDWTEIKKFIGNGCETFAIPFVFENNDGLYIDDEGLLQEKMIGCFMLSQYRQPLVGNAIILGCDEEGETKDARTTKEEIERTIAWGSVRDAELFCEQVMRKPMQFHSIK
jgi:hypothetical protein